MSIRVLLVDDQEAVRAALRDLLDRSGDIVVAGQAADGIEALELVERLRPDVVLMDVRMPRMDGVQATERIVARAGGGPPRVIVLTTFDLDEYVFAALRAGASGFLIKNTAPDELRRAVRVVAAGDALLDPSVTRRVIRHFAAAERPPTEAVARFAALTAREREIATLVASGLTNQEIGEALSVSYWTVKTHIARILAKLDARDRSQIVIAAYQSGAMRNG